MLTALGAMLGLGARLLGPAGHPAGEPGQRPALGGGDRHRSDGAARDDRGIGPDGRVIFGLAPLLHLGDASVTAVIKEGGTRGTPSATRHRVRSGLVAAEIALAVMLVVGAGLLVRSFNNLTRVDAGFDSRNLVTFGFVLPPAAYQQNERRVQFVGDLVRRLSALPGVQSVTAMNGLPPQRECERERHRDGRSAQRGRTIQRRTSTTTRRSRRTICRRWGFRW